MKFLPLLRRCFLTLLALLPVVAANARDLPPEAARLIEQAGNTEDEAERQAALDKLAAMPLDTTLIEEAKNLGAFVRLWNPVSGRLNFFLYAMVEGLNTYKDYDLKVAPDSPLRPIAEFYRGRLFTWLLLEQGSFRHAPVLGMRYKNEALASFAAAEKAFPKNRIPGIYLGRPIPWPKSYPPVPGAPEWAVLQREHLDRLREIIHWWIDHREQPDHSYGGGWGDDCEMRRWWASIMLGFDDPKVTAAQIRFSTASLSRPEMQGGFLGKVRDVEHAAEDTTDCLAPLLILQPGDPRAQAWSRKLTELMERVWSGRNERGELQFRSFHMSATEIDPAPKYAFDVIGNVLALSPALALWQETGDPEMSRPLTAWLDTWVAATARAENGKPAGVLPAAIRWPDGHAAGPEGRWWEPIPIGLGGANYYVFPSVLNEMTDAMLTAYLVTHEQKYLAPIRSMTAIRLKYLKNPPADPLEPGSEAWCARRLGPNADFQTGNSGWLVRTLTKCRTLLGTHEFDELIALEGSEYESGFDAAKQARVEEALRSSIETLRVNFPSFTSEVRYTDRVLSFARFFAQSEDPTSLMRARLPNDRLIYRMVSGDDNAGRIPMPAVRWHTLPEEIAAWVTEASHSQFRAELFHFGAERRKMAAELFLLSPGRYRVELLSAAGQPAGPPLPVLEIKGTRPTVDFQLPPRQSCILRISPEQTPAK